MKKISIKYTIHEYFLKIVLLNLIYFVFAEKLNNNNRNLNNLNNIKLKILDDDDSEDFKCLKFFSGNQYPSSVYLDDEKKDLQDGDCIFINKDNIKEIYIVILEWNKTINSLERFFNNLKNIVEIDLSEFDASEVTSMSSMFYGCNNLKNIKFGNINTSSLTDMSEMFSYCNSLYSIDLSNFDTSKVNSIYQMFYSCYNLFSLNITNMNTSLVTNMDYLFFDLRLLMEIDLSNFDTSKVTSMKGLFMSCKSLTSINFGYFNISKVTNLYGFFYGCLELISIDISKFDTSSVTDMSYMFYGLESCTSLDLSSFNTSNVQNMDSMFTYCISITSINLNGFDTSNVYSMAFMLAACYYLESLDLSNFTFNQPDLSGFFFGDYSLTSIAFSREYKMIDKAAFMFEGCSSLLSVDLYNFDFETIEDLSNLFYECYSLTSINLSYINTFSTINMEYMFYGCNSLIELNLKDWITSSVLNINSMFYDCISLISLDLSNFDTSLVTDMKNLFYNCIKLTSINFGNFKTNKVIDMESMFFGCISLISLNLSSFDTSNVINMQSMFYNCVKLTSLDLSNFNIQNDTNMESMFYDCTNLGYINFYNYNNELLIDNVFFGIQDNLVLCIKKESNKGKINIELSKLKCPIINCSDNWKEYKKRLIYKNGVCINDCKENDNYKYEYEFYCYDECPKGTHSTINNKYLCEKNSYECIKKYPFLFTGNNSCSENCSSEDFFNEKCTLNDYNIESEGIIIRNIINDIENNLMNKLISEYLNDRKDLIIKKNEIIYQITSSWNQNNKQYKNISSIKLKNCENILKAKYNIQTDEALIIFKIEKKIEGLFIPLIEYEIFNPKTKEKLDLNYCKNESIYIDIYTSISINENILFKYDPNNSYYNDICNTYTTENGTDITLYDRKNEYNNNNYFLCPVNCKYINYNLENKTVICQCEPQNGITLDKTKMINTFKNIKQITNFKILKCSELFSKAGLIKNIANYIIFSFIIIYIISLIFFYFKEYKMLCREIDEIIRIKKNNFLNEQILSNEISPNFRFQGKDNRKINKNNNLYNSFSKVNSNITSNDDFNNKTRKEGNISEAHEQNYYDDFEINSINYEEALKKDKRTYCQFYLSLVKSNHIIIFTFFSKGDYNPQSIKICLFFFMFVLYMFVNTLFFNDVIMHQIYENRGIFNFIDVLPQIIYSIIICSIIHIIIKELSLTQKNILEIKYEKNMDNLNSKIIKEMKYINNKLRFFYIFNFIFLIFSWYYLSCFCFIYNNTQIYLFKVISISYSISLFYPFVIYLLPSIIRIFSLKTSGKCFYKISILSQLL